MRELRPLDLLDRSAMNKGGRREEIAVGRDRDLLALERTAKEPLERKVRQRPIPAALPLAAIDRRNPGNRDECHASGFEGRVNLLDRDGHVENQMKRLGENEAVEGLLRQHARIGEVAGECRFRATWGEVEDVLLRDAIATEAT